MASAAAEAGGLKRGISMTGKEAKFGCAALVPPHCTLDVHNAAAAAAAACRRLLPSQPAHRPQPRPIPRLLYCVSCCRDAEAEVVRILKK